MRRVINKLWCSAVALLLSASPQLQAQVFDSEHYRISVVTVAERLDQPWGLAFLPDGDFLVTELSGGLKRVTPDGQHVSITGLPPIQKHGQGGLLDVVLDPDFANNRRIYLTYSGFGGNGIGTDALRGELVDDRLTNASIIFRMRPKSGGGRHFGSRMAWLEDGSLLISLGDRGKRARAQRLDDHIGTIVRINPDGEVPRDNPFVGRADALPEIYSYGHRNVQGMVRDPVTG
ncbi:MAG: PQQ-dependent sugar dehydrogenase, partial [Pseudomonadota bacterium]